MQQGSGAELPISTVIGSKEAVYILNDQGVWTLGQLAEVSVGDLMEIPGIGAVTAPQIHALAHAYVQNAPYWIKPVPSATATPSSFIDIRVDPDARPKQPWGFCHQAPEKLPRFICLDPANAEQQIQLERDQTVTLVADLRTAWQRFAEQLLDETRQIYYWGKVVLTHLQQTAPKKVQQQLKPHLTDLHRVFLASVALPIKSTGLQPVATYLGYRWTGAKAPFEAHLPYLWWLSHRNPDYLQTACTYMAQNVEAVRHIWQWMISQAAA